MIRKLNTTAVLLLITIRVFSQAFSCDHTFYVIMQVNGKSVLHNMWFDESNTLKSQLITLSEPDRRYTCLGLSIGDLHLYALDFNTKELLRINAAGMVTSLGVPENLDTSLDYWAGDVMPEGRRLFVIGNDRTTGVDRAVFTINLTTSNHYAGSSGLVSYLPTAISDLATDPIRGITYGYDKTNKQIVVIGVNTVSHHNHKQIEPVIESLFFDEEGRLFGYGSASSSTEQSTLYAIDKVKGGVTKLVDHVAGMYSDGCSCPYTMRFSRTITPVRILPCTEFAVDYQITNHAGIGKTDVVFEDVFPEAVDIVKVVDHTYTLATIASGVGTNYFFIPNLDVLIGENIIRIKAFLNPTLEKTFQTQASLENLPKGLGGSLLSDNPFTPEPTDPNLTEVVQSDAFELEDYLWFNCAKDTAWLSLPFQTQTYQWSDGSSGSSLAVTKPGTYWVEAVGECFVIKDSILISDFPEPLILDLGEDLQVAEGTTLDLQIATNAASIQKLSWDSEIDFDLSCRDCAAPRLTAQQDNTYYLKLTDRDGCTVEDTLQVTVFPAREIFVPNAFSPNGDGINDVFFIQGSNTRTAIKYLRIFDRWGTMVFEHKAGNINEAAHGWDGLINGRTAAAGMYIWVVRVEYGDGSSHEMSGEINLIPN